MSNLPSEARGIAAAIALALLSGLLAVSCSDGPTSTRLPDGIPTPSLSSGPTDECNENEEWFWLEGHFAFYDVDVSPDKCWDISGGTAPEVAIGYVIEESNHESGSHYVYAWEWGYNCLWNGLGVNPSTRPPTDSFYLGYRQPGKLYFDARDIEVGSDSLCTMVAIWADISGFGETNNALYLFRRLKTPTLNTATYSSQQGEIEIQWSNAEDDCGTCTKYAPGITTEVHRLPDDVIFAVEGGQSSLIDSTFSDGTSTTYTYSVRHVFNPQDVTITPGSGGAGWLRYSDWSNSIEVETGGPPPDPLSVAIVGPEEVCQGTITLWESEVSGGTSPYTYEWSGFGSGSDSYIWATLESKHGSLYLMVSDDGGQQAGDTLLVFGMTGPLCPK